MPLQAAAASSHSYRIGRRHSVSNAVESNRRTRWRRYSHDANRAGGSDARVLDHTLGYACLPHPRPTGRAGNPNSNRSRSFTRIFPRSRYSAPRLPASPDAARPKWSLAARESFGMPWPRAVWLTVSAGISAKSIPLRRSRSRAEPYFLTVR